jgi:hypothetical protein
MAQNKREGKLSFSAKINGWNKHTNIPVTITLTNNTSDTISYVSMSCSWQNIYTIDTKYFSILSNECKNKKVPTCIKIPPHSKEEKNLLLHIVEKNKLQNAQFKVGFHFIEVKKYADVSTKLRELLNEENILWSNALELQ